MKTTVAKINRSLGNDRGLATVEAVPLLVLFVMLVAYSMGLFGMVHTAILYSIGARTYAFETFRNRTNLTYFRENAKDVMHYDRSRIRYHSLQSDTDRTDRNIFIATTRPLAIGFTNPEKQGKQADHLEKVYDLKQRNESVGVSPSWIMVGYGICLDANCGDR